MELNIDILVVMSKLVSYLVKSGEKDLESKAQDKNIVDLNHDLWLLIKKKFSQRSRDEELLKSFADNPASEKIQAIVGYRLEEHLYEDSGFAIIVKELLDKLPKPDVKQINIQRIVGDSNISIQDVGNSVISINK